MTSRPSRRATRSQSARRCITALAPLLLIASACGGTRDGEASSDSAVSPGTTSSPSSASLPNVPSASPLIGRLIDEVVGDSALEASWSLEPIERHTGIVHARVGATHYLLADSLVGYDGPRAQWRIRQAQSVSPPRPGEAWVTSCVVAGTESRDGTIVALVTLTPDDTLPTPHDAWRLDPVAWRFTPYPPATLSCFNEGGGP